MSDGFDPHAIYNQLCAELLLPEPPLPPPPPDWFTSHEPAGGLA